MLEKYRKKGGNGTGEGLKYSISYTTRLRREGEREAIDYYFVDDETFQHMKENHLFIEWAKIHIFMEHLV